MVNIQNIVENYNKMRHKKLPEHEDRSDGDATSRMGEDEDTKPNILTMVFLSWAPFIINMLCFLAVVCVTKYRVGQTSRADLTSVTQQYSLKLSTTSVLYGLLLVLTALAVEQFNEQIAVATCYKVEDHGAAIIVIVIYSVCMLSVRSAHYPKLDPRSLVIFETHGHTESEQVMGHSVFQGALWYSIQFAVIFFVLLAFYLSPLCPATFLDAPKQAYICAPTTLEPTILYLLLILVLYICLPLSIMATEVIYNSKQVPFQKLLNSSYVRTSLLMTYWSLVLMFIAAWVAGTTSTFCVIFAVVFTTIDALWSFTVCAFVTTLAMVLKYTKRNRYAFWDELEKR